MRNGSLTAVMGAAAVLMIAGAVHIVSIVLLPLIAPDDAFARIVAFAPLASVRVLPRASMPGDPLPGRDPSLATAICRYDLGRGPAAGVGRGRIRKVHGVVDPQPGRAWPSMVSTTGPGTDGKLDLVLMTPAQLDRAVAADVEDAPVRDVRVVAPEDEGFITLDALSRIDGYAESEEDLASMSCKVERQP